jgi:GTP cyclohydrolase FolE2
MPIVQDDRMIRKIRKAAVGLLSPIKVNNRTTESIHSHRISIIAGVAEIGD